MSRLTLFGVTALVTVAGLGIGTVFLGDDADDVTTPTATPEQSPVRSTPDDGKGTPDSIPEKTPPTTSAPNDDRSGEKGSGKDSKRSGSPVGDDGDGDEGSDGTATREGDGGAVAA